MPKPLIALVGRPNVGKSTLFNRLVRTRIAVVEDFAGTTRDRLYADCDIWGHACTLIDTGGFDPKGEGYSPAIVAQAQLAIDEADIIVFLTDGREEPTSLDYEVADLLRRTRKPVIVAANKVDNPRMAVSNLNALRIGDPIVLSAATGIGVAELTEKIEELLPRETPEYPQDNSIKVAVVGRPNVGKSALTNKLLGYERSIVSPIAGTTRDAIDTKLEWNDQPVTLIDTAGMRRKARVKAEETSTEYHMVLRALRAVDRCDVVIIVLESGGVTDQDTKIAGYAHEAGKAVLIAVNKWDLIETQEDLKAIRKGKTIRPSLTGGHPEKEARKTLAQKDFEAFVERYLPFISYAPSHFISALTGYGVEEMFNDALEIAPNVHKRVSTGVLNDTIRRAIADHAIPSAKGRQMKIRYATQAETAPPNIILFCNSPDQLHFSYVRYLENAIRKKFEFRGVPLKIELRRGSGEMTKEERLSSKRAAALIADREKYGGEVLPEWEELAARAAMQDEEWTPDDGKVRPETGVLSDDAPDEKTKTPKKPRVNPTRNASQRSRKTGPDVARSGGTKKPTSRGKQASRTGQGTPKPRRNPKGSK